MQLFPTSSQFLMPSQVDVFFRQRQVLEKELTQIIKGGSEIRSRPAERFYATDRVRITDRSPIGMVVPRDDADVIAAVAGVQESTALLF